MESDSKDVIKTGSDGQLKDDPKGPSKSKRSNRRKKSELPPILLPKFPSQKQVKKNNSDDKVERREDDESTPMCPSDKAIEDGDDMEKPPDEQEEEQIDDTQENAPPEQPIVEENPKKPAPEKPPIASDKKVRTDRSQMRPRAKEGLSGRSARSEDRKTRKLAPPTDKADSKRRSGLHRRPSADDLFSEEAKKSYRRSGKVNTKKRKIQQKPPPDPQNANLAASPDGKRERSLIMAVPERSMDEKGRKAAAQPVAQTPPGHTPTVPPPIQTPPPPGGFPPLKKEQKDQGSGGQRSNMGMSSSKGSDAAAKKRKKRGFLKNVYKKTKFWGRKSDCVADPTTEQLGKSYVPPEYDMKNKADFQPDIRKWFSEFKDDQLAMRLKTNPCTSEKEIFLNNRPFWLTPQPGDEAPPKVRIQLHRPLKLLYDKNSLDLLPKFTRTKESCYDPKTADFKVLKQIDKFIGVEETDSARLKERDREAKEKAKEKELKRITTNTFYSTIMFEEEKLRYDEKKKELDPNQAMKETDAGKPTPNEPRVWWKPHVEPSNEEKKKLKPGEYIQKLNIYDRKGRPTPKPREHPNQVPNQVPNPNLKENPTNINKENQKEDQIGKDPKRKFKEISYTMGKARILRKPTVTPTQSPSGTSVSVKSATASSSMEDNKK